MSTPAAEAARTRAWALKEQCYAVWNSEPARAAQAADELRQLADTTSATTAASHPTLSEIQALADWTAGIACLTRAQMPREVAPDEPRRACDQNLHKGTSEVSLTCRTPTGPGVCTLPSGSERG